MLTSGWRWMLRSLLMALPWQLLEWNQTRVHITLKRPACGFSRTVWFSSRWLRGAWGRTGCRKLGLLLVTMDFHGRNLHGKGRHWRKVPCPPALPPARQPGGMGPCRSVAWLGVQEQCFLRKHRVASSLGKALSEGWQPFPKEGTISAPLQRSWCGCAKGD